jgi:hypothetical protein
LKGIRIRLLQKIWGKISVVGKRHVRITKTAVYCAAQTRQYTIFKITFNYDLFPFYLSTLSVVETVKRRMLY